MGRQFVLEGEWTGYKSSQSKIVHRMVVPEKVADALKGHSSIVFTDGTSLLLTVRPCEAREPVKQINGYSTLISNCIVYNVWSVSELNSRRKESR